jgi:cytochrome c oxidase cbb3-type subunit III
MSNFFNWWVIVITLVNIFACYWLIKWTMKKRPEESAAGEATGHTWDELQELNNPLPKWWLWMFYITIIFGLTYLVIFPGLGNWQGVQGWSSHGQYNQEVKESDDKYGPIFNNFAQTEIPLLAKDPKAIQAGKRLFGNYCAQCHGSDAKGTKGFPNLTDNDWLYGGAPETIKATIMNGRNGAMPAWGPVLGEKGVVNVANYVQSLSGRQVDAASAEAGKAQFQTLCVACHGADGKGNQALGAPNLTDNIWLHGGTVASIKNTITNGKNSVMPAHNVFLGNDKSHLLAAYVYSLSN